jgi:hypothetical protein
MTTVYVLTRSPNILRVYLRLDDAQRFFPGRWEPEHNGPIRAPEVWRLGDASIRALPLLLDDPRSGELVRVIRVDNFDRGGEQPGCDDQLVATVRGPAIAAQVAALLNEGASVSAPYLYKAVDRDYKLRRFEP